MCEEDEEWLQKMVKGGGCPPFLARVSEVEAQPFLNVIENSNRPI